MVPRHPAPSSQKRLLAKPDYTSRPVPLPTHLRQILGLPQLPFAAFSAQDASARHGILIFFSTGPAARLDTFVKAVSVLPKELI